MGLSNRGTIGTFSPVALSRSLACVSSDFILMSQIEVWYREGYPNLRTVDYWLGGNTNERFPQSRTICSHNKADGFERRLELYLMENFRHAFDLERSASRFPVYKCTQHYYSYVYYTQIMQAECLAAAYRLWRRNWKGHGKEYTAGALVWQVSKYKEMHRITSKIAFRIDQ